MLDYKKLGRDLKAIREKKGLHQKDLGDKIGLSQTQISRVEQGNARPETFRQVARALDVFIEITVIELK